MRPILHVHCNRAFKGIYVDVRSTQAQRAREENKDIVITCDSFPGKTMTILLEEIETRKAFENPTRYNANDENEIGYTLKAYEFIPDEE